MKIDIDLMYIIGMEKWNDIDFRFAPKSFVLGMVVPFSLFWLGIVVSAFFGGVITKLGCLVPFYVYMVILNFYLDNSSGFIKNEDGRKMGKSISSLRTISYVFAFLSSIALAFCVGRESIFYVQSCVALVNIFVSVPVLVLSCSDHESRYAGPFLY